MTNNENETALVLPTSLRVLLPNGQVEEMKLETYLAGAVAAEIGADAPLEALKAQAVASRTYVASAQRHPEHNADVCTTAHCQKWKRVDPVTAPEVFRALSETWGMVATYDGQLISAFFFEHCDGHTRNAEEMHIPALAYLRGVSCSCGFLTLKGHGVGMCKRGAIVMARRNASFEQILQHYYRGVSIVRTSTETPEAAEPSESEAAPVFVEPPVAPKPRPRAHKAKLPSVEPAKPKRRAPRRVQSRENVASPAPAPVIEITAVPASVALKRIQITPSAPASETEPVAPAETPPAPAVAETPAPAESVAPTAEPTPQPPRVELDFPVQESAPSPGWRLAQAEPIAPMPVVSAPSDAPAPQPTEVVIDDTPSMIARRVHVDHLPGARMICGAMPRAGIVVMIEDARGENTIVYSG
ncbi:MAG: SpoIID/LytB domain-containing protein, partial [Chloroflexota bacterium]